MVQLFTGRKRIRKMFGKIREVAEMPNLIEVQRSSYDLFLNSGDGPERSAVFPIKDFNETSTLEFVSYELEPPKFDVEECQVRDMTYAAPLKVTLRLIVFDVDEETGARSVKDIKEQDVYMGDMPLMTHNGTFVINGTERVIVSQMHRSPGVFFDHDRGKTHASGKLLFAARIIPYRGSWLDFEFDVKDVVFVRIDRRRKLPVTTLLYSLGLDQEGIMDAFYGVVDYKQVKDGWSIPFNVERLKGSKPQFDLINAKDGSVIADAGSKLTPRKLSIHAEASDEITPELLEALTEEHGYKSIPTADIDHIEVGAYIRNTLAADKNMNRDTALLDIYRVMRPGEPPTLEAATEMFESLFFDNERYDLSAVGRVKMNMRLDLDAPDTLRTLRKEDMMAVVKTLVELRDGRGEIDDIDNLGNRRVRSVGELMENQYRVGLLRTERAIKERMSSVDIDTVMPQDLINAKPAAAAVREFFGSSQLSQFMDQTNPLSEVTHKRRLSALGPGGLTRERAGFEVRDVHPVRLRRRKARILV